MLELFAKSWRSIRKDGFLTTLIKSVHHFSDQEPRIKRIRFKDNTFYLVTQDRISKVLLAGESWEDYLNTIACAILPLNANAVDLGANFGFHTIQLAKHLSDGAVFAFEPLSLTFSQLQINVLANECSNIRAFKFAVLDHTGEYVEMDKIYYGRPELNVGNTSIGRGGDAAMSIKLDDMSLPHIDFIKVDIQGSEYRALRGMEELLRRDRPVLFIEIEEHHLRKMGSNSKQVIEYLFSLGYVLLRVKSNYPCDHIGIPEERASTLEAEISRVTPHGLDRLSGRTVELTFERPEIYSGYRINS